MATFDEFYRSLPEDSNKRVIECIVFRALLHRNECLGILFITLVIWKLFRGFALLWRH